MAAHLPEERSPDLLKAGVDSSWVDRNYGYPIAAGLDASGCNVEQIQFVDGVSKGQRQARIVVHGVLDYCTLCIWEVVATPFEVCAWAIGYPSYVYYLVYDDDGKLIRAVNADSDEGLRYKLLPWVVTPIEGLAVNESPDVRNRIVDSILKKEDMKDDLTADNRGITQVDKADNGQPYKKAYEIKHIERESGNDFVYSFEVDMSDCGFATMRTARKEVREAIYADYKEEFLDFQSDFDGRFVRVIVQWNQEGSRLKGRARVVFPKVTKLEYVSGTKKINVELEFDEAMQAEVVRAFAKKTAENLARDKNILLKVGETPEEAPCMSLDERMGVKTGMWKFAVE